MWNHDPVDSDAWVAAGVYDPDAVGAEERRSVLEYLTERGATLEQLTEAHRLGSLPAVAGDLVMGLPRATLSVSELAERCGIPVERVQRIFLAAGLPVAPDGDLPDYLGDLVEAFEQGAELLGEEAILAFTRVLGAAATNVAEAAVALFYAELGPGTEREGADELERARLAEAATLAFTTVPPVLSGVLLAQFDRASRRSAVSRGWATADGDVGAVGGPAEFVAVGFVDLVGSTAWAEGLSLRDHSLALSRFESAAWSSAVLAGGRVVKMIGDEVFFSAPDADAACRIAVDVCRAVGQDPLLPPARAAVGQGVVTSREGDYFGPLVNLVSRLVDTAVPGGVVATAEVAAALPERRWTVSEVGPVAPRGVAQPVSAFAVTDASWD